MQVSAETKKVRSSPFARSQTNDWEVSRRRSWIMFLIPALVVYTLFMAFPLINSMRLSLYQGIGLRPHEFVGFDNYHTLFTDPYWKERFTNALQNTIVFFSIHMLVQNTLGLLFATLLAQNRLFGRDIYRTIIFIPATMSVMLTGFLWSFMLNPAFGMLKPLLTEVGKREWYHAWLGDPKWALVVISLVSSWQWVGLPTMMFLAGLINIPEELNEAARVDGASPLQAWLRIKLPLLKPIVGIVAVLTFIGNFSAFDVVYVMKDARGSPNYSTDIMGTFFYRTAIAGEHPVARPNMGVGAAVATVTFLILMVGVSAWLIYSRRSGEEVTV